MLSAEVLQSMQRDSEDRGGRGRRGEEDGKSKRRPVEREVGRLIQYNVQGLPCVQILLNDNQHASHHMLFCKEFKAESDMTFSSWFLSYKTWWKHHDRFIFKVV